MPNAREKTPHSFYVSAIKQSTYRALLSDDALAALEDIACDDEYAGSGDAHTLSLLATFIHASQMTKVVQIGTWIGFSTIVLAGALARVEADGKPTILTVDPAIPELEKAKKYVQRAGLQDQVQFLAGSSLDPKVQQAVRKSGPYDMAFIDSQHDYEVCSVELRAMWPIVKEGGILAAHDSSNLAIGYDTNKQGGVSRAITEWIKEEGIEQSIFLTYPLWNPVGLFIAYKIPRSEAPPKDFVTAR